jgi:hypothetical protein
LHAMPFGGEELFGRLAWNRTGQFWSQEREFQIDGAEVDRFWSRFLGMFTDDRG